MLVYQKNQEFHSGSEHWTGLKYESSRRYGSSVRSGKSVSSNAGCQAYCSDTVVGHGLLSREPLMGHTRGFTIEVTKARCFEMSDPLIVALLKSNLRSNYDRY